MSDEGILQLDAIRLERNKQRKCVCDLDNINFTLDIANREVICNCGIKYDAFEAMYCMGIRYERINDQHRAMSKQKEDWLKQKPWSILFKKLEKNYHKGRMLPICPRCNRIFDFSEIGSWISSIFYKKDNADE